MMKKTCTRCKGFLPLSHFAKRYKSILLMPWCKPCKRDYDRIAVAEKRAKASPEGGWVTRRGMAKTA